MEQLCPGWARELMEAKLEWLRSCSVELLAAECGDGS